MKKLLITSLVIALSATLFGQQNPDNLIGKWMFKDAYEKEKLDSTGLKMMEMFFADMTFHFSDDHLYEAVIMGKPDKGTWSREGKEMISLASDKGSVMKLEIIKLNKEELIFSMQNSTFIMARMPESEVEELIEIRKTFETVEATNDQITKKWYLKNKESSKPVEDHINEAVNELFKGSYMEFSKKGKYKVKFMNIEEEGKWEFGEGNQSIVVHVKEDKKIWNIISISDEELILKPGLSGEKWTFSSTE